jgi:hypothetical protein
MWNLLLLLSILIAAGITSHAAGGTASLTAAFSISSAAAATA